MGIYENGNLIEVLRTDTDYMLESIKTEAERVANRLQRENSELEYFVREIKSQYHLAKDYI